MACDAATPEAKDAKEKRAHMNQGVYTLLTSSKVGGKSSYPIHPTVSSRRHQPPEYPVWSCFDHFFQAFRTFTQAERKRFQGFPDAYKFAGDVGDVSRPPLQLTDV